MSIETPTGVYLGSWEPGSDEWHAARRHGVGGSELAVILDISPFDSRFALYHRKKGTIPPLDLKDEMEWGVRLEPMIAAKYADMHPEHQVVTCGTYAHIRRPWQVGNPDRLILDGGTLVKPLEIKYSLFGDGWGKSGTEDIPGHYRPQVLHYCDVLGCDEIDVGVFIGGSADYREYTIKADPEEMAWLREQAKDFLDDLDTGQLPEIDGHEATYRAVRELHPEIDGKPIDVPDALVFAFLDAREALAEAEFEKSKAAACLLDFMGSAQAALWNGHKIATRQAKGTGAPYLVAARNLKTLDTNRSAA